MSEFYSDEALAKQAEGERLRAAGEHVPVSLLLGLAEPRVQPGPSERCVRCNSDARPESFGGGDGRHCGLCLGRGYGEEADQ